MTPRLGMHFDDLDEAYNFYNAYGKLAGFSIRKESSNRGKDGEVVWKRFVCSKEGKTDEKHWIGKELVQRHRMETRFDCKAKLQVKLDKSGGYVVFMFVPQHSHAPASPRSKSLSVVSYAFRDACTKLSLTPNGSVCSLGEPLLADYISTGKSAMEASTSSVEAGPSLQEPMMSEAQQTLERELSFIHKAKELAFEGRQKGRCDGVLKSHPFKCLSGCSNR
ncbi:hypothetical protein MRB53_020919 [Persea americana]|uniref:Uncharacterized protein n=1 Tax=Persea americana TaxID=3435 RepID=A0ACC2L296_PERAE|nr:hypothetical protein MRB53_020919 [Persea americana]